MTKRKEQIDLVAFANEVIGDMYNSQRVAAQIEQSVKLERAATDYMLLSKQIKELEKQLDAAKKEILLQCKEGVTAIGDRQIVLSVATQMRVDNKLVEAEIGNLDRFKKPVEVKTLKVF